MESLRYEDIHEVAELIVAAFEEDPVFKASFPDLCQRRCILYSSFASEMLAFSGSSTRVIKGYVNDEENRNHCNSQKRILSVASFREEGRTNVMHCMRAIVAGILQWSCFFVKYALEHFGVCNPLTYAYGIIHAFISLFTVKCTYYLFLYGINSIRSTLAETSFLKEKNWTMKKKKNLTIICTAPEFQGKGLGSQLLKEIINELDGKQYYDGYYLESSNPRNIPFYERNNFVKIGEITIQGQLITFMVREANYKVQNKIFPLQ